MRTFLDSIPFSASALCAPPTVCPLMHVLCEPVPVNEAQHDLCTTTPLCKTVCTAASVTPPRATPRLRDAFVHVQEADAEAGEEDRSVGRVRRDLERDAKERLQVAQQLDPVFSTH